MEGVFELRIVLDLPDEADETDAEEVSRRLRRDLLKTPVDRVDFEHAEALSSPDAKGVDAFSWGSLLVTLSAQGGVLQTLITAVQAFLGRSRARAVSIQIGDDRLELGAASQQDQQKLVEAFLKRHPDSDR